MSKTLKIIILGEIRKKKAKWSRLMREAEKIEQEVQELEKGMDSHGEDNQ